MARCGLCCCVASVTRCYATMSLMPKSWTCSNLYVSNQWHDSLKEEAPLKRGNSIAKRPQPEFIRHPSTRNLRDHHAAEHRRTGPFACCQIRPGGARCPIEP